MKEKSPVTKPMLSCLSKITTAMVGQNLNEYLVRDVCRLSGYASIGQQELSPTLKEFRESFDGTPKERFNLLADIIPESVLIAQVMLAQTYVSERINAKYAEDENFKASFQQKMAEFEQSNTQYREQVKLVAEERDNLQKALENANEVNTELNNRISKLERDNAVLQGRLLEREVQQKGKGSKVSRNVKKPAQPPAKTGRRSNASPVENLQDAGQGAQD